MSNLKNKKTISLVTTIFVFLISSSFISLMSTTSTLSVESSEIDDSKNTLRSSAVSHLFAGMYIDHIYTSGTPSPSTFDYIPLTGDLWIETWDIPPGTWIVDALTRVMTGGSVFGDGTHTPAFLGPSQG